MPELTIAQLHVSSRTFSLLKRALVCLLVLALVLAVFAGVYSYQTSYEEVSDFQKDHLKNIALLLANEEFDDNKMQHRHYRTEANDGGLLIDILIRNHDEDENNVKYVAVNEQLPLTALTHAQVAVIPKGLSHQRIGHHTWQVYRYHDDEKIVIVRQSSDLQDDLAQSSAWQSVMPVLAAMLLFSVLLVWVMWKLFLPLRSLSEQVRTRHSHDLRPLQIQALPQELAPFVDEINQLLRQVSDDIQRQQRFIADVSHELRSPLTAISLQVQRLQQLPSDDKMRHGLAKLYLRVKRNQDLVEKLLTLAKIDQAQTADQTVVFRPIIEQSIMLLLPLIDAKNLNFQLDIMPDKLETSISSDETAILILIKNLLQNAVLYTPDEGYVCVRLHSVASWERVLRAQSMQIVGMKPIDKLPNKALLLQVIDSGFGMMPEQYLKAFDAFVRLEAEQDDRSDLVQNHVQFDKGTGLGLALVKSICVKLGIQLYLSPSEQSCYNPTNTRGLCVSLVFLDSTN